MAQAYIIECGDDDAGVVTQEGRGFLFHAANRTYRRLEGQNETEQDSRRNARRENHCRHGCANSSERADGRTFH